MPDPTTFDGGFTFTEAELRDPAAFAAKVETSRQVMLKALDAPEHPINVWTSGQCVLQVQGSYEARCATCGQPLVSESVEVQA